MLKYGKYWFKEDYEQINTKINRESIFNSFCFAIMGFSVITKISSLFITQLPTAHFQTPIMYIYAIIFSPVIEELICRKYLFSKLYKKYNFWVASIISSVLFAIPHWNLVGFLGYVFIGVVWSYYYNKTNNILVPICSHLLFNYFVILFMSLRG